jgi:ATP-dependent Clp protease ATP-binding subunit ClpC
VFERFTERARQVVVLAQDEARSLGHDWIGTEHLLLGLLREEEGIAARVLEQRKIDLEAVRSRLGEIHAPSEQVSTGQIPFTPRAKGVLEHSLREAQVLGHDWIGTEHILLGLLREPDGLAVRMIAELGAPPGAVAEDVLRVLGGGARASELAETFAGSVSPPGLWRAPPPGHIPGRQRVFGVLVVGWVLFGVAFGLGLLAGWLIWR